MTEPLKMLFNSFVSFTQNKPDHNFPIVVAWRALGTRITAWPEKADRVLAFYITKHATLYTDPVAIYGILALFRLVLLIQRYKDRYRWEEKYGDNIPVGTPLSQNYSYEIYTDKCINIRDDDSKTLRAIKNMPAKYSNKGSLLSLINCAEISTVVKELLLHAVKKPGGNYMHTIAHMTLGDQANYGKPHSDTPLKRLAVKSDETYLHYYSIQLADYRKRWFLSRCNNARETLIDYKMSNYSIFLEEALRFLENPIVLIPVKQD
jgi:hypothetical protein